MDDASLGVSHFGKWSPGVGGVQHIPKIVEQERRHAPWRGRIGAKHGGRTRKQFGGGLNRPVAGPVAGPVARPIGGVGAGVGAGVRAPVRPLGYKKGGHVKSMGIAKRGGGAAKR